MKQTFTTTKTKSSKIGTKKGFIPKSYFLNLLPMKGQYMILESNGKLFLYVSPLLHTSVNNMKTLVNPQRENLSRDIKERCDMNSVRLLRKGLETSKEVTIKGNQYLLVKVDFYKVNDSTIEIMNNNTYLTSKSV